MIDSENWHRFETPDKQFQNHSKADTVVSYYCSSKAMCNCIISKKMLVYTRRANHEQLTFLNKREELMGLPEGRELGWNSLKWKKDWISTCYQNILVPLCFLSLLKATLLVQLVRSNSVLFVLLTNIDLHNSTSNIFHARLRGMRPSAAESVLVSLVFFLTMPLLMHGGF